MCGELRNAYNILVRSLEARDHLGNLGVGEGDITTGVIEIEFLGTGCIHLAEGILRGMR
jgi:hypothetical protein